MNAIVITILKQIMATENTVGEQELLIDARDVEEEYYTINEEALICILQTIACQNKPKQNLEEANKISKMTEFFELQIELFALLAD